MTIHLSYSCPAYVLQIGDRLLSKSVGGRIEPWDSYSNKTHLIHTVNGFVVVSYAGASHIGPNPTDMWLLERILQSGDRDGSWGDLGPEGSMAIGAPLSLNLGHIVRGIAKGINKDFVAQKHATRTLGIEILISGWTWPRKTRFGYGRLSTFSTVMTHDGRRGSEATISRSKTKFSAQDPCPANQCSVVTIGKPLPNLTKVQFGEFLGGFKSTVTAYEIEQFFVDSIRKYARSRPGAGIGTELMSILLQPTAPAKIRFLRDIGLGATTSAFSPGYLHYSGMALTPALIKGSMPSFVTGTEEFPHAVTVECIPPLPPSSGGAFMATPRKSPDW